MSHQQDSGSEGPRRSIIVPVLAFMSYVLAVACAVVAIRAAMAGNAGLTMAEVIASLAFLVVALALTMGFPA